MRVAILFKFLILDKLLQHNLKKRFNLNFRILQYVKFNMNIFIYLLKIY
jgi:hypothetical protein